MNNNNDLLVWQDAWLLGIDNLDQDHMKMVQLINSLIDQSPPDNTSIQQRVAALMKHLHRHFAAEEAFLRRIDYPDYCAHKHEHRLELSEITALTRALEDSAQRTVDIIIFREIKHWFLNHAVLEDRRFADYFVQQHNSLVDMQAPLAAEPDCA